jgi:hypothetical protein
MKGQWEAPSPEQEQIIALSAAVSSLKAKSGRAQGKDKKTSPEKKTPDAKSKGPRKNEGSYAWKDVPPKAGDPKSKGVKGKTYYWCTNHEHPQWSLHNPNAFPNLCKRHPNYSALEAAWTASGSGANGAAKPTAADIQLDSALAEIEEESESDSGDY